MDPVTTSLIITTVAGIIISLATLGVNLLQSTKIHDINISSCISKNNKYKKSSSNSTDSFKKKKKKKKR
jgi:hypothetical protein